MRATAVSSNATAVDIRQAEEVLEAGLSRGRRRLLVATGGVTLCAAVVAVRAGVGDADGVADPGTAALLAGARALATFGLVLSAGAIGFVAAAWPEGLRDHRFQRLAVLGWTVLAAATVLHLTLATTAGLALPTLARDRVFLALVARVGLLAVAGAWVLAVRRRGRGGGRPTRRLRAAGMRSDAAAAAGGVLFVAVAMTFIYAGPATPGATTVAATLLHITAACLWLGGLATLAVALVPSGATVGLDTTLARFSIIAPACVVVLAATGTLHAILRTGSAGRLFTTGYGHAYWFKVAAVVAMLAVANGNRRYVSRHVRGRPDPGLAPLHMLGLYLGAEVAFGLLVIVLTGTLVDAPVA